MRLDHHWRVFAVTTFSLFMPSLDGTMIAVGFGEIEASFPGTSASTLSWVFTGYSIALTALVVATGRIGDRRGRRRTFMAGLVLFALGAAVGAAAPTVGVLIAGRVLQGTGHAFLMPSSMGLILAAWPAHDRTTAVAAWVAVGGVAAAIGPTLGAVIFEGPGWRAAFLLHVVTGSVALVWARRALPDTVRNADVEPPDPVGIVLVTALLGLTTLGIVEGRNWGWTSVATLGVLGVAVVIVLPLFVGRSRVHDAPVVDPDLLRRPSFRWALMVSLTASMAPHPEPGDHLPVRAGRVGLQRLASRPGPDPHPGARPRCSRPFRGDSSAGSATGRSS